MRQMVWSWDPVCVPLHLHDAAARMLDIPVPAPADDNKHDVQP